MSITIVATILVFGLLVFVHEFGHFIVAKMVGMRVDEFAIGFGPKVIGRKYGETLYSLRAVPLGGFNKIAGMDSEEEQDEKSFCVKPIWARMAVIVAGSAMNFILPIILFTFIFFAVGIDTPSSEPILGKIFADKPAAHAGLLTGDQVLTINGNTTASWKEFVNTIQSNPDKQLTVRILRNGSVMETTVIPEFDEKANKAIIGVMPKIDHYDPGAFESVKLAIDRTISIIGAMVISLGQMATGKIAADLAGPIGVAQMTGEVAQMGLVPLFQFAAFLSLNLGIINLLPVPMLDGGHVVALAIEGVRGKPLSAQKMRIIQMIGFILLMLLMFLATFKDITRLKLL